MSDGVEGFWEVDGDNHDVRVYQQYLVIVSRMDIMAALGKPDGRKARRLENVRLLAEDKKKVGYKKRQTTIRSKMRIRTGVMDTGLNSAGWEGEGTRDEAGLKLFIGLVW